MRPRLKYRRIESGAPGEVRLHIPDEPDDLVLEDADSTVSSLLALLDGSFELDEIVAAMLRQHPSLTSADVNSGINGLDALRLVEDADARTRLTSAQLERYASNIAFFRRTATLDKSAMLIQERLCEAHVVLLGVGGLGCNVLMNLAGLGVGTIDLVDPDRVELSNLVRQFLYRESDVGDLKVEAAARAVRGINSSIAIRTFDLRIRGAEDLRELFQGADLVIMAIDAVRDTLSAVNDMAIDQNIPFIHGGWWAWGSRYCTVLPRKSGCLRCAGFDPSGMPQDQPEGRGHVNPGTGPVASSLGGLVSLEALRVLTGYAEPIAAGRMLLFDVASGDQSVQMQWAKDPNCAACGSGRG